MIDQSICYFDAAYWGIHRLELTAANARFNNIANADCSDLRAQQDGVEIPIWVTPESSKAGESAIVFLRTNSASGRVHIYSETNDLFDRYRGKSLFAREPMRAARATLSCYHSEYVDGEEAPIAITAFVHPSVVYIPDDGIGGHNYWMACTPWGVEGLSPENKLEEPCIFYSDDGLAWTAADVDGNGNSNIDVWSEDEYFHSDPHMVWDGTNLWCYYNRTKSGGDDPVKERIMYCTTTDGTTWTSPAACTGLPTDKVCPVTSETMSVYLTRFAIWRKAADEWHLYLNPITEVAGDNYVTKVSRWTSENGKAWVFDQDIPNFWDSDHNGPNHIDVQYDSNYDRLIMVYPQQRKLAGLTGRNYALFAAVSHDEGDTWVQDPQPLARSGNSVDGSVGHWGRELYRSCIYPISGTTWGFATTWKGSGNSAGADKLNGIGFGPLTIDPAATSRTIPGCMAVSAVSDDFEMTPPLTKTDVDGTIAKYDPAWILRLGHVEVHDNIMSVYRGSGAGDVRVGGYVGEGWTVEFRARMLEGRHTTGRLLLHTSSLMGVYWDRNDTVDNLRFISGGKDTTKLTVDANWHRFEVKRIGSTWQLWVDGVQKLPTTPGQWTTSAQNDQNNPGLALGASGVSADVDGADFDWVICYPTVLPTVTVKRATTGGLRPIVF